MRYLIHETQAGDIPGRNCYLYDIFHLYFLPRKSEGGYISLIPIGTKGPDILFITGHTDQVENYLQAYIQTIPEKTIIVTTCLPEKLKKFKNKKDFYVPNIDGIFCYTRDGKQYGFDFNPSDAELNMYNASGTINQKIQAAYRRL